MRKILKKKIEKIKQKWNWKKKKLEKTSQSWMKENELINKYFAAGNFLKKKT